MDTHARNFRRYLVNTVEAVKELRNKTIPGPTQPTNQHLDMFKCGEVGHIRLRCPLTKKKNSGANFVFAVDNIAIILTGQWIIDSGSSRHLVNESSLLTDPIACSSECLSTATDGRALRITLKCTVNIKVVALGIVNTMRLHNV